MLAQHSNKKPLVLVSDSGDSTKRDTVMERFHFFSSTPESGVDFATRAGCLALFSMRPILRFDASAPPGLLLRLRQATYNVDPELNPDDGWAWCEFSKNGTPRLAIERAAPAKLKARVSQMRKSGYEKCYLFGTGTSLASAIERDWNDGYRVVCNTIVRDQRLWNHLAPHFIVAGDAIYHFGFTKFARAFRADLANRLRETDTCFVFPSLFSPLVQREFAEFEDRLIPIPSGRHRDIHVDLTHRFETPHLGNILNLLLLPLGCTLSRQVHLWGFDGRAPNDKLFWSNSSQHSYPDLMDSLQKAHPAFFRHHVPADRPAAYVQNVHGDQLEVSLKRAEAQGWKFVMMHRSWTATLQKRYHPNVD